ncbi:hypothetical protein BH24ACT3_BH24ACT3_09320 [soil metagenome]
MTVSRRLFLKTAAAVGAGAIVAPSAVLANRLLTGGPALAPAR